MKYLESFKDIFTFKKLPDNVIKLSKVIFNFLELNFLTERRFKSDKKFYLDKYNFKKSGGGTVYSIFYLGDRMIGFYYNKFTKNLMLAFLNIKNNDTDANEVNDLNTFLIYKIEKIAIKKKSNKDEIDLWIELDNIQSVIEIFNNPDLKKEFETFTVAKNDYLRKLKNVNLSKEELYDIIFKKFRKAVSNEIYLKWKEEYKLRKDVEKYNL
jgi:hypothetical protein